MDDLKIKIKGTEVNVAEVGRLIDKSPELKLLLEHMAGKYDIVDINNINNTYFNIGMRKGILSILALASKQQTKRTPTKRTQKGKK